MLLQGSSYYGPGRKDAFYVSQLEGERGEWSYNAKHFNLASGWRQDLGVEAEFKKRGRKLCLLIEVLLIEEATHACLAVIVAANFLSKGYASCLTL